MARMTRKEKIWEGFAQALATRIADKFLNEQTEVIKVAKKDAEDLVINKYFLPLKKKLDALPEHVVCTSNRLYVQPDTPNHDRYYAAEIRLGEEARVPHRLIVPEEIYNLISGNSKQEYAAREKYHKLFNDLFNNLVVAESYEEVVTKWPECRELADEVSLTYATTMNVPLEKILGRYVAAIEATPSLKQLTSK